jgi:hypothetical protein
VSTRRLIISALICGLAILLAGAVMLIRLARDREHFTVRVLAVDAPATIDGVRVRIISQERSAGVAVVVVALDTPPDHGLADAGLGFSLNIGGLRDPKTPVGTEVPACRGLTLAPAQSVPCALGFSDRVGSATLAYAAHGEQAEWSLGR